MRRILILVGLLLLTTPGHAQTVIDAYEAAYYNEGAPSPIQVENFAASAVVCGQAPPSTINPVNPSRLVWDDPNSAGQVCVYVAPAGSPLLSVPLPGDYEGTLKAINAGGASAESARAPFSRLGPPAAPQGLRIVR